jgi:short-subunit dehydrogenase
MRLGRLRSSPRDRGSAAGSVVIVTGASSGIGRALALRLGAAGARVGLIARRREPLEAAAATINAAGGTSLVAIADVGDRSALHAAIAELERRLGPTDVLVANAGFGAPTMLEPLNTSDVEATFQINVLGMVYAVDAVLPGMLTRRKGHLLAVSSLAAFKGLPGESAYCASKAAVNAYMEGLRIALRTRGIAVTTVCPGFVATSMTPMNSATPFLMSADAAAHRIARLITRRTSGVVRFPLPMALLTDLIARLPDALVARLVPVESAPQGDPGRDSARPVPVFLEPAGCEPSRPQRRGDAG